MALGRSRASRAPRPTVLATLTLVLTLGAIGPAAAVSSVARPSERGTAPGGTSVAAQELQDLVDTSRAAYEEARVRVAALSAQSERLQADTERADAVAAALRADVADEAGGLMHALGDMISPGESDVDRAADAAADAVDARKLSDMVEPVLAEAIDQAEEERARWEHAQQRQQRIEATWGARKVLAVAMRRAEPTPAYDVPDAEQDRRNRRALAGWKQHLRRLGTAAVAPPPARTLAEPRHLVAPLEIVRDADLRGISGVAQARLPDGGRVIVLPAETVRVVSAAFARLGVPATSDDPLAVACGGLAATVWSSVRGTFPADAPGQWQELREVRPESRQTGDLVLLGRHGSGLDATGVYVGSNRAIVADATTGTPRVQVVRPRDLAGVRRPTLTAPSNGHAKAHPAPPGGACATPDPQPAVTDSPPLRVPLEAGSYRLSAGFDQAGSLWSSGAHTGQDFAAPTGTPVLASGSGVVTIEHPGWAGNLVRVDDGGGVETWYAHLSRVDVVDGQQVDAGAVIGAVGDLGNTTGPHLHFEVRLDGVAYDPLQVLDVPEAPRPPSVNGAVPDSELCPATTDGAQWLRCDAAVAFRLLATAYASDLGSSLCITDSYRSRSVQERTFVTKPNLAAVPGTSVHGWGLAVDLCGGIESFDTAEHAWLMAHGPAYGWQHPSWAEAGGSRPEPWHFEYAG